MAHRTKTQGYARNVLALLLLTAASAASAEPFFWTDWESFDASSGFTAQGTITTSSASVGVTYSNPNGVYFADLGNGSGYNYPASGNGLDFWQNTCNGCGRDDSISPYTSSLVDNSPTGTDIIALQFAGNQTLSFSEAIANPVFSFVSLNGNGYAFDQDFEILSAGGADGNACGFWGCGTSYKNIVDLGGGNFEYQLLGTGEPHGTLRFSGTFDTLNWRSLSNETWNGFTVGVQGSATEIIENCSTNPSLPGCENIPTVPEPGIAWLLISGLFAQSILRRRNKIA